MNVQRALRLLAGFMVMLSLALSVWVHPYFLFLNLFVGVNLFQSAFTNWCPAMTIMRKFGIKE